MSLMTELVKQGLVTEEQLNDARQKQFGAKKPIQEVLVDMGFVKEPDLMRVASDVFKTPVVDLTKETIDSALMKKVPYEKAKRYGACPLRMEDNRLILAMSDPQDVMALDDLKLVAGCPVKGVLSPKSEINACIDRIYQSDESMYDLLKNIVDDTHVELVKESAQARRPVKAEELQEEKSPVVRLVNLILTDAVKTRASDIHIEPQEDFVEIRYRIDGYLKNIMKVPKNMQQRLIARVKILADLDIAECRKPQDGRTRVIVNGKKTDLRISIVPAFYGEKVVARLLGTAESGTGLDKIGFSPEELNILKKSIAEPQGMILVTGPTGSGKTSTLYAVLSHLKSETKNIITIEDPVEYIIEGLNQIQINPVKDVTFASGLRSILRQDPNIILVGEIRDRETADIAFRSSLTGHLVFSTLHTNNSIATITRLMDIGLEPYLIASSLLLVVAQRLVRVICPHCKKEDPENKCYKGAGCEQCGFTGYIGRTAIFEMLPVTEAMKKLVTEKAPEGRILEEAKRSGYMSLADAGAKKVAQGITTPDEVLRVAGSVEAEVSEKESAAQTEAPAKPRAKPKIVVADDEDDVLMVICKRLKDAGYDVVRAHNGKEGVEAVFREKPDLVITDVMMPVMDGYELTKTLRSKLETGTVPIIMLTARGDKESELKGLDAGADDYMAKPFDHEKLLARVKMLLRRGAAKSGT